MIDLTNAVLIGKGNARWCYQHPLEPKQVIKVPRDAQKGREQNRVDHYYLRSLERRGVPTRHVPRQHGIVATSLGDGLAMDLVASDDGTPAPTLSSLVRGGVMTREEAYATLEVVLQHFSEHGIVMVDTGLVNFVCKREGERWLAVAIDGLGGRHFDWKLLLRAHLPFFARLKLRNQWRRMLPKIDKL